MVKFFRNLFFIVLTQVMIYLMLFILLPNALGVLRSFLFTPLVVIFIYGVMIYKYKGSFGYWIIGIFVLWRLILIYHPHQIYGFVESNLGGLGFSRSQEIFIFCFRLFVLQGVLTFVLSFFKKPVIQHIEIIEIKNIEQVYDVYDNRSKYKGEIVSFEGILNSTYNEIANKTYYYVTKNDESKDNAEVGFEVIYAGKYPNSGDYIRVTGELGEYVEYGVSNECIFATELETLANKND